MKTLWLIVVPAFFACSSPRHLALGDQTTDARCSAPCAAEVRRLPNGNCLITCDDSNGDPCEIEIACDGDSCEVVRCDGGDCCESTKSTR